MTAIILDGKKLSAEIREELKVESQLLKNKGIIPGLAGILVGEDPGSATYIGLKSKACEETGVQELMHRLPDNVTEKELLETIQKLNTDKRVHGIFIQLPLPENLAAVEAKALAQVVPEKDVDGFHTVNIGRAWLGQIAFFPAVVVAIQEILRRNNYAPKYKNVVIVNVDNMVGKPLASLLVQDVEGAKANVTLCHPETPDLLEYTSRADLLVVSINKPKFFTVDMVKDGAAVIDFGGSWISDPLTGKRKTVGDVDFDAVKEKASMITPVPGGVGPMLVTMLMANTIKSAKLAVGF